MIFTDVICHPSPSKLHSLNKYLHFLNNWTSIQITTDSKEWCVALNIVP